MRITSVCTGESRAPDFRKRARAIRLRYRLRRIDSGLGHGACTLLTQTAFHPPPQEKKKDFHESGSKRRTQTHARMSSTGRRPVGKDEPLRNIIRIVIAHLKRAREQLLPFRPSLLVPTFTPSPWGARLRSPFFLFRLFSSRSLFLFYSIYSFPLSAFSIPIYTLSFYFSSRFASASRYLPSHRTLHSIVFSHSTGSSAAAPISASGSEGAAGHRVSS